MTTKVMSEIHRTEHKVDVSKEMEWMAQHRHEYIGEWVVLHRDRLIGHGSDPIPFVQQARKEGVRSPFVTFIRDESEPFMGGWL